MNYILFDDERRDLFFPLSLTNTIADLLIGMFTNRKRWEIYLSNITSTISAGELNRKYPVKVEDDNLLINSRLIPEKNIVNEIHTLKSGEKLLSGENVIAMRLGGKELQGIIEKTAGKKTLTYAQAFVKSDIRVVKSNFNVLMIENIWDFFSLNGEVMRTDLSILDKSEFKDKSGESNTYIGDKLFIHNSAKVSACVLNSSEGPIVIDANAEIMEGTLIRGPVYIGKNAVLKMGAKIYGATSIGDFSKVGGEVNNSVVNAYSNKAHDGFIGNSVIGYWCNLGADTNTSNLKNDYSMVKLWNYEKESFVNTGLQFLGLIMGDHSKCGINTMFNTGTVVGVSCNIYGSGFQSNFIPSFSWGKAGSYTTYQLDKAIRVAQMVMERRNITLSGTEEMLLSYIFESSLGMRNKFHKTP